MSKDDLLQEQSELTSQVGLWRQLIQGQDKCWVVFEHGTCLVLPEAQPEEDLSAQAIQLLSEWGPVQGGSSAGDFQVYELTSPPGWIVTGHHPEIVNYVDMKDFTTEHPPDYLIGLIGRGQRDLDARSLHIIHIEDNR